MNNNHNIDELDNIDEKYHVDEIMWLARSWSSAANLSSHDPKVDCLRFFFTRYELPEFCSVSRGNLIKPIFLIQTQGGISFFIMPPLPFHLGFSTEFLAGPYVG
jgi:hypothetical protein